MIPARSKLVTFSIITGALLFTQSLSADSGFSRDKKKTHDKTIWGNRGYISGGKPAMTLSKNDMLYLENLARDTWECLDYLWEPVTGLPYDNIYRGGNTSVTNIGMGFASVTGAYLMGYISREEAVALLKRSVESLGKMKKWHGFCQSWNDVKTLKPSKDDYWVSTLDTGNLVGGMLAAKNTFPELALDIADYLDAIDWSWMADESGQHLRGGYITNEDRFVGPLTLLGGDPRLSCFLSIAFGGTKRSMWGSLDRNRETKYGVEYLVPGWQGGGLFMQYISGLFMSEWASFLNRSSANFAYAQILHALANSYPVWGWSASDSPKDGYLGWGHLKDSVVTPHASVLAVSHYPQQVVRNLRKLEEMGARAPYEVKGELKAFGFRDAIDIESREVTNNYLYLDQGMLFLSLVNFLRADVIRKAGDAESEVKKTKKRISDYNPVGEGAFTEILHLRDNAPGSKEIPALELRAK